MAYEEAWQAITSHPDWATLPTNVRKEVTRNFISKFVYPVAGRSSDQTKQFIQDNLISPFSNGANAGTGAREITNPLEAFGASLRQETLNNTMGGHALGAVAKSWGGDPTTDESSFYVNGPVNTGAAVLGRMAAQAGDPIGNLLGHGVAKAGAGAATNVAKQVVRQVAPGIAGLAKAAGVSLSPRIAAQAVTPVRNLVLGGATGATIGAGDAAIQQYTGGELSPWEIAQAAAQGTALGTLGGIHAPKARAVPRINEAPVVNAPEQTKTAPAPGASDRIGKLPTQNLMDLHTRLSAKANAGDTQARSLVQQIEHELAQRGHGNPGLTDAVFQHLDDRANPGRAQAAPSQPVLQLPQPRIGPRMQLPAGPQPSEPIPMGGEMQRALPPAPRAGALPAGDQPLLLSAPEPVDSAVTRKQYLDGLYQQHAAARQALEAVNAKLTLANVNQRLSNGPRISVRDRAGLEARAQELHGHLADLEQLMMYLEGQSTPPRPTDGAVSTDAAAPALSEFNAGLNLRKAPEALAKVHQQLSDLTAKLTGKATEAVAGAVNRAAGRDVLRGGYDPATGQDRLGNQAAEWYDWLLNDANTGGKVPLVDKALDVARSGLKSDHNLPAEFVARKKLSQEESRAIRNQGTDLATGIKDNLSPEDNARLYDVLNDRTATNTDLADHSEKIRSTINNLSQQMHDLGVLSDSAYQTNEGQYLKRLYQKHLDSAPGLVKFAQKMASTAVKGSKFRGKKVDLSQSAFDTFSKPWELVSQDGKTATIRAGEETRTVPARSAGDYLGTWRQLGAGKGGSVMAWRDWTPDERMGMGEVRNAAVAVKASMDQAARDLPHARLLKDVASNSEWAVPEGGEVPEGWVHFPSQRNQGGTLKWGALSGHYVEPNIARDLVVAEAYRNPSELGKTWRAVVREVKKNQTSRNPASHGNNFFQNVFALELNGGSVTDLPDAVKVLREQGDTFKQLRDAGLFADVSGAVDLGLEAGELKPGISDAFKALMGAVAKLDAKEAASKAAGVVGATDRAVGNLYMGADDMFRAALALGKMRQGMPLKEAVALARERMYNPESSAPWVMKLRDTGVIPFVRAFHWSASEVPKMVLRNPGKAALLVAYWQAYKAWANAMNGDTKEQADVREALRPEYLQGPATTLPVPFRDTKGQRLMVDTKQWVPWNFVDTSEQGAIPILSGIQPGGVYSPLLNLLSQNYDPMRRKPIRNENKPLPSQVADVAGYAWNAYGPAGLTRGLGRLGAAMAGNADNSGRRYDVPTALVNLAGVKLQPTNDQQAIANAYRGSQADEREARAVIQDARRQLLKGAISREDFDRTAQQQAEIIRNIRQRTADLMRKARVLNK